MNFEIKNKNFYLDGEEIKLISGAVHYFRNMPDRWTNIFKKLKALGCNCIETYCPWNMHEKNQGEFDFSGILNVKGFIEKAGQEGLMVIVRPGPYICAEWEFGGLPWWILRYDDMKIRSSNATFVDCFKRYLERLFNEIRPLLSTNGGPIIMMQIENEYGCYGDDKIYLKFLYDFYLKSKIDVPLFTSNAPIEQMLLNGTIDGCLSTLNFGSRAIENFKIHDKLFSDQPKMCMELWDGWFDAWGDSIHHQTDPNVYANVVDEMLKIGSCNIYMFIGGTNFGFMNGANHYEKFAPDVTSYDYDALLTERGEITKKYHAVKKVIQKHLNKPLPNFCEDFPIIAYGKVKLESFGGIFDNLDILSKPIYSDLPMNMEYYGQGYGYIVYQTKLKSDYDGAKLSFESLGDRAQIYIGKDLKGIIYVNDGDLSLTFSAKKGDLLTIICENMGRTNYGDKMMRKKGIVGKCLIDGKVHVGWSVYPLPMDNLDRIEFRNKKPKETTCFYKGYLRVDETADTYISLKNFTKGFVTINGFNLGRYWEIGPQKNLFVPMSVLKEGENELIVFESDGLKGEPVVEFVSTCELG